MNFSVENLIFFSLFKFEAVGGWVCGVDMLAWPHSPELSRRTVSPTEAGSGKDSGADTTRLVLVEIDDRMLRCCDTATRL